MSPSPNKITQFWQELKRRRVHRLMAIYAGTAYVIFEASTLIFPRWGLPDWTIDLVLYLLILGAIVTFVMGWIYDINPEGGMVKTEPVDVAAEIEAESKPVRRKFRVSDLIIAILFIIVLILVYPKIFKKDKFASLRDEEGVISLAVLPFDNLTGDSSLYYWQNGISEYLINRLANSQELTVSSSQAIMDVLANTQEVSSASLSPDIARLTARKIDASTYITGNFIGRENDASIMLNLVNAENGEILWTTSVNGDLGSYYRAVLNHLSDTVRNYMEIRALENQAEPDLTSAFPNSSEAYRNYIDGLNAFFDRDYESAIESLNTAYELDTTFTFAAFYLAIAVQWRNVTDEGILRWIKRAYELKNNIPAAYRPWIEIFYAIYITKNGDQIRRSADKMYEEAFNNRYYWFDLATFFSTWLHDYPKAIKAYQRVEALNRQYDDVWKFAPYYSYYAKDLLLADRPEEAIRIADIGLKVNPSGVWLMAHKGAAYFMLNDSISAQIQKKEIRKMMEENNSPEERVLYVFGWMHLNAKDTIGAVGYFRQSFEMNREWLPSLQKLIDCQLRTNLNLEECHELIEYGLKVYPNEARFLRLKGLYLHKMGKHQEALEILQEVQDKNLQYDYQLQKDIQEVERSLNQKTGS